MSSEEINKFLTDNFKSESELRLEVRCMSKQIGNLEVPEIINKYDAYGNICNSNEQYYHNRNKETTTPVI